MKFEHLVEINDFLNPLVETLTRETLWKGLLHSAEDPAEFLAAIDEVKILERRSDGIDRELHFGSTVIRDHVRIKPLQEIEIRTDATPTIPAARKLMRIEEPAPGELFVRFLYERYPQGHEPMTPEEAQALKNAWLQADRDLIAHIRLLACEPPLH
ncbi:hypothetical protein DSM104443_02414 [Usitatibacter rugosus]|uniref:DUF1857 family protein n=1 Tax=Usitatibacter rugosus TaxID=2732067 RepID=A0A6M4GVR0_9PROT|nr:AtaL-like protein [Usitatibacter rugosus]QJR11339.1 hypothetical protein DSM104443_02414 [Usitatibacter rugosus]